MIDTYNVWAKVLHWAIALLVAAQIALGLRTDAAKPPESGKLLDAHVQVGVIILMLMMLRLLWRMGHAPPPELPGTPKWQSVLAKLVHASLYVVLLVLPVSGYALWMWIGMETRLFGVVLLPVPDLAGKDEFWRSIAGYTHEYAFYLLAGLLATHVGAALWHQFIRRDNLVGRRMLGFKSSPRP